VTAAPDQLVAATLGDLLSEGCDEVVVNSLVWLSPVQVTYDAHHWVGYSALGSKHRDSRTILLLSVSSGRSREQAET